MGTDINLSLKSKDWDLLHSISHENGLSLNKTCRLLVELGLYTYRLNNEIIDNI